MSQKKNFKGVRLNEPFVAVYRSVLDSQALSDLTPHACKLLFDLLRQYKGDNNGNLTLAWGIVSKHGSRSRTTLWRCKKELIDAGFIYVTRKGHFPSTTELLALTWFPLDVSPKFDIEALSGFVPKAYVGQRDNRPLIVTNQLSVAR
jgi:hypothetical protein